MNRPSWDEYFLTIAKEVSTRSTCLRRRVGAVFVKDKRILTTGYNGPPQGLPHCDKAGCLREDVPSGESLDRCRAMHAEANGVIQAARYGISIDQSTVYCTTVPCFSCAKLLLSAGVSRVVFSEGYPSDLGVKLLKEAGVPLEQVHTDGEEASICCKMSKMRCSCSDVGA